MWKGYTVLVIATTNQRNQPGIPFLIRSSSIQVWVMFDLIHVFDPFLSERMSSWSPVVGFEPAKCLILKYPE